MIEELKDVLGEENVLTDKVDLLTYSRDRFSLLAHCRFLKLADVVVRPANTEEVVEVVKIANKYKVPVIPTGGRTNFVGSAAPVKGGIVIDLLRMDRILEISKEDWLVRTQAGVVLERLEKELNKHDLTLGHDIGGSPSATIGGAISTDGTGYMANKYDTIRHMVIGLEVVTPTADVIKIRDVPKSASGLNIRYLFVGAEGMLGIITEATLKVKPKPKFFEIIVFAFKDFLTAFRAAESIIDSGIVPTICVSNDEVRSESFKDYLKPNQKGTLILGIDEFFYEAFVFKKSKVIEICEKMGGKKLPDEAGSTWFKNRHDAYPRANLVKNYDVIEMSIRRSKVPELYRRSLEIIKKYGMENPGMGSFTIEPCTFSVDLYYDEKDEKDIERYIKVAKELMKTAIDLGGTPTHCVGVGLRGKDLVEYEHGEAYKLMKDIKKLIDPNNIMNPGKWL